MPPKLALPRSNATLASTGGKKDANKDGDNNDVAFKTLVGVRERREIAAMARRAHPDRVPIVIEPASSGVQKCYLEKRRYLPPQDITFGQFLYLIRKRMTNLSSSDAIFLFVAGRIPANSETVGAIYEQEKDPEDGILYVRYSPESTFG